MGDYTNGQLVVYACPSDEVEAIVGSIDDHDLGLEFMAGDGWTEELRLGATYGGEVSVGLVYDSNLAELAPNAIYQLWVDPKYEFMGDLEIRVPTLGTFHGTCNADGMPLIDEGDLEAVVKRLGSDATAAQVIEALEGRLGRPWLRAIAELSDGEGTVVRPPRT